MSYKNYQFKKMYEDVVRATGRPLSYIETGSDEDRERVAQLINEALRMFWDDARGFFPGTFAVEQRTIDPTDFYVLKEESGATAIGRVELDECFFEDEPDPESLYLALDRVEDRGDRILCLDADCPAQPWIRFQLPCPEFTRAAYDPNVAYDTADLVYDDSTGTGECYKSLIDENLGIALTDPDSWEPVRFPDLAKIFVKWWASAEMMAENDGQGAQFGRANREIARLEDVYLPVRKVRR